MKSRGIFFWLNFLLLWILLYGCWIQISGFLISRLPFSHTWIVALNCLFVFCALVVFISLCRDAVWNKRIFFIVAGSWAALEILLSFNKTVPLTEDVYRSPLPYAEYSGQRNTQFTITPTQMGEPEPNTPVAYPLNSFGLRFEEKLTAEKPEGEYRVFVLGGSTVFNGYPIQHSIPGVLEELLRKNGKPKARVYNCGVVGHVSGQEMALLLHYLVDLKPDMVVVYDGGNDMYGALQYDPRPGYPMNFISYEAAIRRLSQNMPTRDMLNSLLYKSRVLRALFGKGLLNEIISMEDVRKETGYATPDWEQRVANKYVSNHTKLIGLAKGFNFKLFVFLQPMIYMTRGYMDDPIKGKSPAAHYMLRQYDRIRPQFRALQQSCESAASPCYFADLSLLLKDKEPSCFWDIIHVDRATNRFIAETIFNHISKRGR